MCRQKQVNIPELADEVQQVSHAVHEDERRHGGEYETLWGGGAIADITRMGQHGVAPDGQDQDPSAE